MFRQLARLARGSFLASTLPAALGLAACGEEPTKDPPAQNDTQNLCQPGRVVACEDAMILELNLQDTPAPGTISNTASGDGWTSVVDATAGGFNANPPHAYVYASFGADGLTKVSLDDEASLASMDWDIAFRRYLARINSGNSGPSCVTAATLPGGTTYESVTQIPSNLTYEGDDFFDTSCTMIEDSSGLPGNPATALSGFWQYGSCLMMTDNVYVLQLRNGRHVKLIVDAYYSPTTAQDQCDDFGTSGGGTSGMLTLRWAFLD